MEFPARLIKIERALTILMLACVAWVAYLEARSPLAGALRAGRPWIGRVRLKPASDAEFAAAYTEQGVLSVIYLGRTSWAELAQEIGAPAAAAPEMTFAPAPGNFADPPLAAAAALTPRTLGAWASALGRRPSFERLLFLLESARIGSGKIQPAYLPDDAADRRAFLEHVFATDAAPEEVSRSPITVEVLNASGQKGVASDVTKFLRSDGADVVHYGNLETARSNTIVYDRTGRFENAEWVRDRLGCRASAVMQVDAKSLVDVTVVLADDCKL